MNKKGLTVKHQFGRGCCPANSFVSKKSLLTTLRTLRKTHDKNKKV
jgi:hypothetical protein